MLSVDKSVQQCYSVGCCGEGSTCPDTNSCSYDNAGNANCCHDVTPIITGCDAVNDCAQCDKSCYKNFNNMQDNSLYCCPGAAPIELCRVNCDNCDGTCTVDAASFPFCCPNKQISNKIAFQ
jgi:hypothetical protein